MSSAQYSTATYEGWQRFCERPGPAEPPRMSIAELEKLSERDRERYNESRRVWHGNILLRTPQVDAVHEQLHDLLDSNVQEPGFVRPAAAIDSPPSLGKSTTLDAFGRAFFLKQVRTLGPHVDEGGDVLRIPVCKIPLPGEVTIKGLHLQIHRFYAHPAAAAAAYGRMPSRDLAASAAECVTRHETRLLLVDDIHFLKPNTENGEKVANELKWLANEYPATFVFAGVGLEGHGLFSEGRDRKSLALAQTGRRWMQLEVNPFDLTAPRGDRVWEATLLAIEKKLVLARMKPGMLTDLHDYLFIRSTGVIGSLMQLIRLGSARAIRTGRERLDEELLEEIKIDAAGQAAQGITAAQLARHRLHHPLRGRVKKK